MKFAIIAKQGYIEIKLGDKIIPIGCEFSPAIIRAFYIAEELEKKGKNTKETIYINDVEDNNENKG